MGLADIADDQPRHLVIDDLEGIIELGLGIETDGGGAHWLTSATFSVPRRETREFSSYGQNASASSTTAIPRKNRNAIPRLNYADICACSRSQTTANTPQGKV
jgi:hypothetical protein